MTTFFDNVNSELGPFTVLNILWLWAFDFFFLMSLRGSFIFLLLYNRLRRVLCHDEVKKKGDDKKVKL